MAAQEKSLAVVPRATMAVRYEAPDIFQTGEMLARSGYFQDARDAAQTFVKILAGRELGIGDIAAMTGIYIVKGRVTLSANLMAALVKRSGRYNYRVLKMDDTACEIAFYEDGQPCGNSSFTAADARAAGLAGDNWKKFPKNMLFARAMSNGVKWYCPDVSMAPIYTPDELGAQVDAESGEVLDAEPVRDDAGEARPQSPTVQPQRVQDEVSRAEPARATPDTQKPLQEPASAERRELLEQVTARCVELGYDTAKQLKARAHAVKKTDAELREEVIPSLDKLITARRTAESGLRAAIYAEFARMEYSREGIEEYMRKNHDSAVLEQMPLEHLREVAAKMEIR